MNIRDLLYQPKPIKEIAENLVVLSKEDRLEAIDYLLGYEDGTKLAFDALKYAEKHLSKQAADKIEECLVALRF